LAKIRSNDVDAFERDGVVCLRGLFDQEWLDLLARGIARDIETPGRFFKDNSPPGSAGRYLTDFWAWLHIAEFREFAFESPAAAIAASLLRSPQALFLEDNWFLKEPGAETRTPWHQDIPYYDIEGRMLSIWMPLEPVTRDNGIEFVRGSHRWRRLFIPANFTTGEATQDVRGTHYEVIPDVQADRGAYDIFAWEMSPGDCIVFDGLTVHGAPGNPSGRTIRRMSTRWTHPDAIYRKRGLKYSDLISGHDLADGALLRDCKRLFPLLPK
jgi:ectoine hydroxylase-related dioxygenase (phytanoyl-CoA dioxygenase family)